MLDDAGTDDDRRLPSTCARGPSTTSIRIASELSGAEVYQVEVAGQQFVLKLASPHEAPDEWRSAVAIQRIAAQAGRTPEVVHVVDDAQRAVLTRFVADRGFPAFYRSPATHADALVALGTTVRRIHGLAIPAGARVRDPREFLAGLWKSIGTDFVVPAFVVAAVKRARDTVPPPGERASILSHNDLNPSNPFTTAGASPSSIGPPPALAIPSTISRRSPSSYAWTKRPVCAFSRPTTVEPQPRPSPNGWCTRADWLRSWQAAPRCCLGTPEGQWAFGLALVKDSLVG